MTQTQTSTPSHGRDRMDPKYFAGATGEAVRSRTYSWPDPAPILSHLGRSSGLEMLRAMLDGEVPSPPIMWTLGFEPALTEVEEGRAVFGLHPHEMHGNPLGTVHGGVLAALLDTATACAVHSTLSAGEGYTTADISVKFLRPATMEGGPIRAEATVISRGGRTALAQGSVTDGRGRLLAHATSTCMIFPLSGAAAG